MEINEVKLGDTVTFTHNKKKVMGKVIYRHDDSDNKKAERASLMGHVNVEIHGDKSYPVTVHVSKLKPAIKEETEMEKPINETVLDLIDHIDSGDNLAAEATLNNILQQRAQEVLDALKVEVASSMFNTEECSDCVEEEKKMKKEMEDDEEEDDEEDMDEEVKVGDTVSPNYGPNKGKKTKVTRVHPNKSVDTESGYHSPGAYDHHANEEVTNEALKGGQHKIDANKNGKIDAHDFKLLRGRKTPKTERMDRALAKRVENNKKMKEEVEQTDESVTAGLIGAGVGLAMAARGASRAAKTPLSGPRSGTKNYLKNFAKGMVGMKDKPKTKAKTQKEEVELDEASYSAKKARAGKDIGKPGKMFGKIAKKASRKYGKERGAKIAGAVLAKLRKKGK